jgi:hypothetical protein
MDACYLNHGGPVPTCQAKPRFPRWHRSLQLSVQALQNLVRVMRDAVAGRTREPRLAATAPAVAQTQSL